MSFSVSLHAVAPAELNKAREDNEHFGAIFGEDEDSEASAEAAAPRLDLADLADFTDTPTLLHRAGYLTLHETSDFDASADDEEELEYSSYDMRVAAPATVKKIAEELASVTLTLERVREAGVAVELRTDRTRGEVTPEGYVEQFAEIERVRVRECGHDSLFDAPGFAAWISYRGAAASHGAQCGPTRSLSALRSGPGARDAALGEGLRGSHRTSPVAPSRGLLRDGAALRALGKEPSGTHCDGARYLAADARMGARAQPVRDWCCGRTRRLDRAGRARADATQVRRRLRLQLQLSGLPRA